MPQIINTNIASMNAQRNLDTSQNSLRTSLQRLSSGLRVNSAKDDAAGLAVAERMQEQSRGMAVAMRNANDGISMAQTAEAGLGVIAGHLQRMRELAVQSANGTLSTADRSALNQEFGQLRTEINRVMKATQFNGKTALTGGLSNVIFQVGSTTGSESQITVQISSLAGQLSALKLGSVGISAGAALSAMKFTSAALDVINGARAKLGAIQARFEGVITQLSSSKENIDASRSRIMDADYAAETANLSRAQILQQAGTAMLAQANALPQNVLSLLK